MNIDIGKKRQVLIAGGGIGGLAAGVAFARLGFCVTILEQADDFREVGAGVQIGPNGIRALEALGLMGGIRSYAWRPSAAAFAAYAESRYHRTARVQFSARQLVELCQVGGVMAEVRARYFGNRSEQQLHDGLAWLYSTRANEVFE
jgi:2-polyprenyl-6-methoxyphenol hydroxylase-like FAD-dependent oxidoreductase